MKKITFLLFLCTLLSLGSYGQTSLSTNSNGVNKTIQQGPAGTASGINGNTLFGTRLSETVTHSASQAITLFTGITCNGGGILSGDNFFYRVFDLSTFGITDDFRVRSVEFGVETITTATTFPVTVNVYSAAPGTFPGGLGTLRATGTADLTNADTGTVVSVTVDGVVPVGEELIYEVLASGDGATTYFPGANSAGETDDSYIAAPACGVASPVTHASIGFPGTHLVMNIIGHRVIPPIISCPADINVPNQAGVCGAVVNFGAATAIDPEGDAVIVTQTMGDPSGSVFPVGVSTIEFTATDIDGETATCQFTITVNDVEDPTIACSADITQTNDPGVCGANVTVPPAVPMDNCPTAPAPSVVGPLTQMIFIGGDLADTPYAFSGLGNSVGGDVNVAVEYTGDFGFSTEHFLLEGPDGSTVLDEAGGLAGDCGVSNTSFIVAEATWNGWITTFGTTLTFTLQADPDVDLFCALNEFTLTATLGTAGVLTNDFNGTADASDFYPVGTTVVTWTYTDPAGNSASCMQSITVTDDEAPVIACEGEPVNTTDSASATPGTVIDGSADVVSVISVTDDFTLTDMDVDLDIPHAWVGDLIITLESPTGTVVTLLNAPVNGAGDCSEDDVLATLDDEAGSNVDAECGPGSPAINGTFMPSSPLSAFDGESTLGDWTLTVTDIFPPGDNGVLSAWTINYSHDVVGTPFEVDLDANGFASFPASDLLASVSDNCGAVTTTVGDMTSENLTTTFASDNGQSGNMFDIMAINDLTVQSFDINMDGGTTDDVEVYFKTGTWVGSDMTPGDWTLLDTAVGITSAGSDVPTPLNLSLGQAVGAGQTVAFYVTLVNTTNIAYTNGGTTGDLFASDANMEFYEGAGKAYPFGGTFEPRIFNGNILYDVDGVSPTVELDCSNLGSNLIEVTVTDGSGNVSTCFATVNVNDVTAPVITCGPDPNLMGSTSDSPGTAIIDNTTVSTTMTVTDDFMITDLNVAVDITHTWTGDLTLTLESPAGTQVVIFDDADGCSANDLSTLLDDQSANALNCDPGGGGTDADAFPEADYVPSNPLSAFNGEGTLGDWILTIEDDAGGDQGTLNSWSLNYSYPNTNTDIIIELDENGEATIDPFDIISGVVEACGIATSAVDVTLVTCADIGTPLTVTAFVVDVGGNPAVCSATVIVVDLLAPVIVCPADQTVDPGPGNLFYEVPDYFGTAEATVTDNCTDPVTITTQDPAPGALIPDGVYTVTLTAEDDEGNIGSCTFELTVESLLGVEDNILNNSITMYPNPARDIVNIANSSNINLEQAVIFDTNGRIINTINLRDMQGEMAIDVSALASGIYMVQIAGENASTVKRLVKE